jgi:hypothetical protein
MAALNFIKGSIKGKVGQFVGSSWKGKDYIKTYAPPSNPGTEGQVGVRNIFQHVGHIAKAIYEPVLKPYAFPKPQKMTTFNRMAQINKEMFDDKEWGQTKLKIFDGGLYNPGVTSAAADAQSGVSVVITFAGTGGSAAGIPVGVVHDEASEKTFSAVGDKREAGAIAVPLALPAGQTDLTKLHAYRIFSQPPTLGAGEAGRVSNTAYAAVTSP